MNDMEVLLYTLLEHTERIADSLEKTTALMSPEPDEPVGSAPEAKADRRAALSMFLENLPTWQYNCLRRKLLPAGLAAKMLGISPAQLNALTKAGAIKGKGGRYDILNLLMWLDSQANDERTENEASHR